MRTVPSHSSVPALILLAPSRRLGQTVSTRPTFALFVRDAGSWQIEFRLYEHGLTNGTFKLVKEIKDQGLKSSPGIMVLSLSESNSQLSTGKRYRWQIELVCNSSRPSSNLFAEAEIEVVPMPLKLRTQLSATRDRLNQANIYASVKSLVRRLGHCFDSKQRFDKHEKAAIFSARYSSGERHRARGVTKKRNLPNSTLTKSSKIPFDCEARSNRFTSDSINMFHTEN